MPLKRPIRILLTAQARAQLESIARGLALRHRSGVLAKNRAGSRGGATVSATAAKLGTQRRVVQKWGQRFVKKRMDGSWTLGAAAGRRVFAPVVATHLVKLVCELPDDVGSPLALWTCGELARKRVETQVVSALSAQSVQRLLSWPRLKPWRVHHGLSSKVPRDEDFRARVREIGELYRRPLAPKEVVLCAEEKTSLARRSCSNCSRRSSARRRRPSW